MSENDFIDRLAELRYLREVSSRRMSLSLGHEPDYIYSIEYGNYLPTMKEFFEIWLSRRNSHGIFWLSRYFCTRT